MRGGAKIHIVKTTRHNRKAAKGIRTASGQAAKDAIEKAAAEAAGPTKGSIEETLKLTEEAIGEAIKADMDAVKGPP